MSWTKADRLKYNQQYRSEHKDDPKWKASQRERCRKFRHHLKAHIVKLMGGKCSRCGFNEHLFGLEFDHKDPKTKKYNPGSLIGSCNKQRAIDYITKNCILLCANCHALKTVAYSDNLRGRNISDTTTERELFEFTKRKKKPRKPKI